MQRESYFTREWRDLPRDGECVVAFLFGRLAGACGGTHHRHHVDPQDPESRTLEVCAHHHPKLQAAARRLDERPKWKRCPHRAGTHRYREGLIECERRLNRDFIAA